MLFATNIYNYLKFVVEVSQAWLRTNDKVINNSLPFKSHFESQMNSPHI